LFPEGRSYAENYLTQGPEPVLSLNDYLERLNARAIDPNEFIEESGRLIRIARRKESNQRHRAKNRKNEAAGISKWKGQNPDRGQAQGARDSDGTIIARSSRSTPRQDYPGFDEVDSTFMAAVEEARSKGVAGALDSNPDGTPATNVYPLHRTTLWADGGWRRQNTSTELAAGLGKPTLGEECPGYFLYYEDKRPHHSDEIIEWLLSLPGRYGPEQGFPDGVNFVIYAFNYGATQVLADLPPNKVWEITRKKIFKTKRKTKYPTFKGYAIDFLKSKWLKLRKLRDPNKPYKERLDKNGNVKFKANGKPEMEIDAIAYIGIDDSMGFYQSRFTKATAPLIKQGYVAE
jgi:hypothetical protein